MQSNDFWFLIRALSEFVEHEGVGQLPLPGIVPDMKADTESFVALQKLYRDKAAKDAEKFFQILDKLTKPLGRTIARDLASRFCKGSSFVSLQRSRSLHEEHTNGLSKNFGICS